MSVPEKNCTISSLLQPKGRPRRRTSPSPAVSGQFGPVCFMTQSISTLLDLNTESTRRQGRQLIQLHQRQWACSSKISPQSWVVRTFDISVTHSFSVFLYCKLKVLLWLQLHKGFPTGTPLSCVSEVNAASIVEDFAICIELNVRI